MQTLCQCWLLPGGVGAAAGVGAVSAAAGGGFGGSGAFNSVMTRALSSFLPTCCCRQLFRKTLCLEVTHSASTHSPCTNHHSANPMNSNSTGVETQSNRMQGDNSVSTEAEKSTVGKQMPECQVVGRISLRPPHTHHHRSTLSAISAATARPRSAVAAPWLTLLTSNQTKTSFNSNEQHFVCELNFRTKQ
jgi:hypothetical protein